MREFLELVKQMREAQKRYFKERSQAALVESKILERKVDLALLRRAQEREEQEEIPLP